MNHLLNAQNTEIYRPKSVEEAIELLKEFGCKAKVVSGNTTLYQFFKQGAMEGVEALIDVSKTGLKYVRERKEEVVIGATTTPAELINSAPIAQASPVRVLRQAAAAIHPPQIRHMGTIGGSLCSGIPFYDLPVATLASDADLVLRSARGERAIGIDDFFKDYFSTAIAEDELLTEVRVRKPADACVLATSFTKLGRSSSDFAVVNVATVLHVNEQSLKTEKASVALGCVDRRPIRLTPVEETLVDKIADDDAVKRASASKIDLDPTESIHASSQYKAKVIPYLIRKGLEAALNDLYVELARKVSRT
jgi:carbon-monoxide dehydrogenase medium subunit